VGVVIPISLCKF